MMLVRACKAGEASIAHMDLHRGRQHHSQPPGFAHAGLGVHAVPLHWHLPTQRGVQHLIMMRLPRLRGATVSRKSSRVEAEQRESVVDEARPQQTEYTQVCRPKGPQGQTGQAEGHKGPTRRAEGPSRPSCRAEGPRGWTHRAEGLLGINGPGGPNGFNGSTCTMSGLSGHNGLAASTASSA
jgi:hypothetical protein